MFALLPLLLASPVFVPEPESEPESVAPMPDLTPGRWHAWLDCPGGELPFDMRVEQTDSGPRAWILNGPEEIEVGRIEPRDGGLVFHLDPYDSRLVTRVLEDGEALEGHWERFRGEGVPGTRMAFHAKAGDAPRFLVSQTLPVPVGRTIVGRWSVQFEESDEPAVGVFELLRPGVLGGTFLTTLGDYRYLEGAFDGMHVFLSCFDGAHAFLFKAKFQQDETLAGDFWSRDAWHETWTARLDPDAALPDPFQLSTWTGNVPLDEVRFPDLSGKERSLADPEFAGKARLLVLFGSWCPNCKDETTYLSELERRYAGRGLSILGLAFEFEEHEAARRAKLERYRKHHAVTYPILVAGPTDKKEASKRFPLLDRVRAYPTTVFMDKEGNVRAVYTGFSGPATGAEHTRLRERFEGLIDELLGEAR